MEPIWSGLHRPSRALLAGGIFVVAFIGAGHGLIRLPFSAGGPQSGVGTVTLSGSVLDSSGQPVPGATVEMNGQAVQADPRGQYQLHTASSTHLDGFAWAPGYTLQPLDVHAQGNGLISGEINVNFDGSYALHSALDNPAYRARVEGLPILSGSAPLTASLFGTADTPLLSKVMVTGPNGHVHAYRLHREGTKFYASVPLKRKGTYDVEINAESGLAVFNVLVFHGVKPAAPAISPAAAPPQNLSPAQLAAYVMGLVNSFRSTMHLPAVSLSSSLTRIALSHNQDMITHEYVDTHPHIGSDGSTPMARMQRSGLKIRVSGEDVAQARSPATALILFENSPIHRKTLIGPFHWAGIGVTKSSGQYVVTIDMAG